MMISQLISSFNAGEMSPYLWSRTNLEKYRNGCRYLQNFLVTPYGPANRRGGTEYLGTTKNANQQVRLITLNLYGNQSYVMELGSGYMRFWKSSLTGSQWITTAAQLKNSDGTPVEAQAYDHSGNLIYGATATYYGTDQVWITGYTGPIGNISNAHLLGLVSADVEISSQNTSLSYAVSGSKTYSTPTTFSVNNLSATGATIGTNTYVSGSTSTGKLYYLNLPSTPTQGSVAVGTTFTVPVAAAAQLGYTVSSGIVTGSATATLTVTVIGLGSQSYNGGTWTGTGTGGAGTYLVQLSYVPTSGGFATSLSAGTTTVTVNAFSITNSSSWVFTGTVVNGDLEISSVTNSTLFATNGLNVGDVLYVSNVSTGLTITKKNIGYNGVYTTFQSPSVYSNTPYSVLVSTVALGYATATSAWTAAALPGTGNIVLTNPYQQSDLRGVQVAQINNVIYLTHPNYPPLRLSHYSDTDWRIGEISYADSTAPTSWPPMCSINATYSQNVANISGNSSLSTTTLTPSSFSTSAPMTITASATQSIGLNNAGFQSGHLGAYLQLDYPNPISYVSTPLVSNQSSASLLVRGTWNLVTYGYWNAHLILEISADNIHWTTLRSYVSSNNFNATDTGTTETLMYLRLTVRGAISSGESNLNTDSSTLVPAMAMLSPANPTLSGFARILAVNSSTQVSAQWVQPPGIVTTPVTAISVSTTNAIITGIGSSQVEIGGYVTLQYSGNLDTSDISTFLNTFQVTAVTANTVTVTVPSGTNTPAGISSNQWTISNTNTSCGTWYEGAFSGVQGFPNCVGIHESRLIFGGTLLLPSSLWGSVVNDFQNFKQGPFESDSYLFTLNGVTPATIQWILSKAAMVVGTTLGEWSLSAASPTAPLTPSNVQALKQSHYGSANVPGIIVNDTIIYVQRFARKIREFVYSWQLQAWVSNELTANSDQATLGDIVEIAYQRVPDANYWFVRGDGQLVQMLYEREQAIVGFSRHTTGNSDLFESCAIINGNQTEDEVWVSVNRGGTRFIERFRPGQRYALDTGNQNSWWYSDCALSATNTNTVSGFPTSLAGRSVNAWTSTTSSGVTTFTPITGLTISSSGTVTLPSTVSSAIVGLPYTSLLCPNRLDTNLQNGTLQGRKMRIPKISINTFQSFGGQYSTDNVNWYPLNGQSYTSGNSLLNGYERTYAQSNWADGVDIYLKQSMPTPLSIISIAAWLEAGENDIN